MGLTRREFIFLGAATGATVATGVIVPISILARDADEEAVDTVPTDTTIPAEPTTPTTTTLPPAEPDVPMAAVGFFPRVKVADLAGLEEGVPVKFDYPLVGQRNILVKMGEPVIGGVGPDGDVVAFSTLCTHMGCEIEEYRHDHKVLGPCPCHFSTFDLVHGGMITLGQATQNLPQVLLSVDGNDVMAAGVLRLVYGYANTLEGAELVEESA